LQGFRALSSRYLWLSEWLAGDAVLFAPVSGEIPCQQGIFQGKLQFWADRDDCGAANRLLAAAFQAIPYSNYQGK
jgi:hypothetical protein